MIAQKKGIRQNELAKRTYYAPATVNKWFKGIRSPRIEDFEILAEELGYKVVLKKIGDEEEDDLK